MENYHFQVIPLVTVKLHIPPFSQYVLFCKFPFLFWTLFSLTDITLCLKVRNSLSYLHNSFSQSVSLSM